MRRGWSTVGVTLALALAACEPQPRAGASAAKNADADAEDAAEPRVGPADPRAAADAARAEGQGVALTLAVELPTASGARPTADGLYGGVPAGWQPRLVCTVENLADRPLTVPNGKDEQGYMISPCGLELELTSADGRSWSANPGAGGPALPVGPEHFTTLAPGETLTRRVPLGNRLPSADPRAQLWTHPARYRVRARWVGREPDAVGRAAPALGGAQGTTSAAPALAPWPGKTAWAELTFELP